MTDMPVLVIGIIVSTVTVLVVLVYGSLKQFWTPRRIFWGVVLCYIPMMVGAAITSIIENRYFLLIVSEIMFFLISVIMGLAMSQYAKLEPWRRFLRISDDHMKK